MRSRCGLASISYPNPTGFKVGRGYTTFGYLNEFNSTTGTVYWHGTTADAWGRIVLESYGGGGINGSHQTDPNTGQPLNLHLAIERSEERLGNLESGDGERLPRVELGREARIRIDRRHRGDVAAAAEILGEHPAHELVEVEILGQFHARRLGEQPAKRKLSAPAAPHRRSASARRAIRNPGSPTARTRLVSSD